MNSFQRLYFLSRAFSLTVFAPRKSTFVDCLEPGTPVIHSKWQATVGVITSFFLRLTSTRAFRDYDIIITEPSSLLLCGYFWRKVTGRPWVVDIWDIPIRFAHGPVVKRWLTVVIRHFCRIAMRHANLYIVSIVPDLQLRWFDLSSSRQVSFGNAIWETSTKVPTGHSTCTLPPFTILCMRTTHGPDMGLDTLSAAFSKLRSFGFAVKLCIVGRISGSTEDHIRSLRGDPDVIFQEFVPHTSLMKMLQDAWVCVIPFKNVPDLSQTFPIKVLEYLALHKVIVASRILGLSRTLVDGSNAILFEPGNPEDLAQKLKMLFSDRSLYDRIQMASSLPPDATAPGKASKICNSLVTLIEGNTQGRPA